MSTLTEKAYRCIKEGIVRGEIEEGVFLSEKEITKRYRVGRTPFREACNRLHHEHLLEVVPRRGYLVSQMSLQEFRDLFEVRVLVEGAVAELAAMRATEREIDELADLADQSIPPNSPGKGANHRAELNSLFHLRLAAMAHNRELLRLESGVLERTRRLSYRHAYSLSAKGQELSLQGLHRPIVDAIRARDRDAARRAVIHDIQQAQTTLVGLGMPDGGRTTPDTRSESEAVLSALASVDEQ